MSKKQILQLFENIEKELILKENASNELDINLNNSLNKTDREKVLLLFDEVEQEILNVGVVKEQKKLPNKKEIDKTFVRAALDTFYRQEKKDSKTENNKIETQISPLLLLPETSDIQNISNSIIDILLNSIASLFIAYHLLLNKDFLLVFDSNEALLLIIPLMFIFCLTWIFMGTFQLAIWGKTVGARLMGIIVISEDGNLPGFKRSLLRTISQLPVFLTLGLINLVFLKKVYFHDFIAGTRKVSLLKKLDKY